MSKYHFYKSDNIEFVSVNDTEICFEEHCHDFKCVHADDMYNSELIERFRHFKETEGGMSEMCKLIEDRLNEEKIDAIKALLMLGKLTREEIANSLNVSIELVENVANGKVA